MTKRELSAIDQLWAATCCGRNEVVRRKSVAKSLLAKGLILERLNRNRDRLGSFTWTTHELTHQGTYIAVQRASAAFDALSPAEQAAAMESMEPSS